MFKFIKDNIHWIITIVFGLVAAAMAVGAVITQVYTIHIGYYLFLSVMFFVISVLTNMMMSRIKVLDEDVRFWRELSKYARSKGDLDRAILQDLIGTDKRLIEREKRLHKKYTELERKEDNGT